MISPKIQYISNGDSAQQQYAHIDKALTLGIRWVQLRWKDAPYADLHALALSVKKNCAHHQAVFIINDNIDLALEVDADGVHLGMDDASVASARQLLGPNKVIGGSANTFRQVLQRADEGCQYIGLGPLHRSPTKHNLNPILGHSGMRSILSHIQTLQHLSIPPIYAIGGIRETDIELLHQYGCYGIACSSLIQDYNNNSPFIKDERHG